MPPACTRSAVGGPSSTIGIAMRVSRHTLGLIASEKARSPLSPGAAASPARPSSRRWLRPAAAAAALGCSLLWVGIRLEVLPVNELCAGELLPLA